MFMYVRVSTLFIIMFVYSYFHADFATPDMGDEDKSQCEARNDSTSTE